ncbi:MAG: hypothetical protein H6Q00_167 [Holophagaceae bacterium]|nr:hypothetical protein [Holophagaceae bacterium]
MGYVQAGEHRGDSYGYVLFSQAAKGPVGFQTPSPALTVNRWRTIQTHPDLDIVGSTQVDQVVRHAGPVGLEGDGGGPPLVADPVHNGRDQAGGQGGFPPGDLDMKGLA